MNDIVALNLNKMSMKICLQTLPNVVNVNLNSFLNRAVFVIHFMISATFPLYKESQRYSAFTWGYLIVI